MVEKKFEFSDEIKALLMKFKSKTGVRGILIFSNKGDLLGYELSPSINKEKLVEICVEYVSIVEKYQDMLSVGYTKQTVVQYESGRIIISKFKENLYVAMIFDESSGIDPGDADRHRFFKKASMKQGIESEFLI